MGDACFEEVMYAMQTGVVENPQWYLPLTSNSSFEDFQQHLHSVARLAHVCPEPCAASEDCHTSVEGDACYEEVTYAMQTGVAEHPEWYLPLTMSSSFEDFQQFLHGVPRLAHVCQVPCATQAPEFSLPPRLPAASEECQTPVEGDACYEEVMHAKRAALEHPEWYHPLTNRSSFEDFQEHLHARLGHVCPRPCPARTSALRLPAAGAVVHEVQVPSRLPALSEDCHTSVKGDTCYEEVMYAMQTGVVEHPEWYLPLNKSSSFEDFQQHLHGSARLAQLCPVPCASQPRFPALSEDCHTCVEGEACYEEVVYAMQTGIAEHPEWYLPLSKLSSFEDFQQHLHGVARLAHLCPVPCASQVPEIQVPPRSPTASEDCHTSVKGDACYEEVMYAMQTGVLEHPEWYLPLNKSSSFEDFQQHLHGVARLAHVCHLPCAAHAPEFQVSPRVPAAAKDCRTSVQGDACYEEVVYAMQTGVLEHPEWYLPLTMSSSFEDFQQFLHGVPRLAHVCQVPCATRAPELPLPSRLPAASEECHTSVEGDACYEEVMHAKLAALEHPEWYHPLTNSSSFEDFQEHLHARLRHVCPKPCPAQGSALRLPSSRVWTSATPVPTLPTIYDNVGTPMPTALHVGTPMPTEIHEDALLDSSYPGYAQVGRNCECGAKIKSFSEEFAELDLCAFECNLYPNCKSIGLHPWQSIWRGHCDLFDAVCPDTNGHDDNTTCSDPVPEAAISVNFNRVPTPAPTPSPTNAVGPCSVTDGSFPSSFYPCQCGPSVCMTSQICSYDVWHEEPCGPINYLEVEYPCTDPGIGSEYFSYSGDSAVGAPVYSNSDGNYLYWDASCDGLERPIQYQAPFWIFDQGEPSMTALMDLDSDGRCTYFGHHGTFDYHGVPLGNSTWTISCGGVEVNVSVRITFLSTIPTPAPTLASPAVCTCDTDSCAIFPYMDIDGDTCLSEEEVDRIEHLAGHFDELDADGDGCVTRQECADSPYAADLPNFPITGPAECDYGFYFMPGTSVCTECSTGETRRRRSEACTECPAGKEDLGQFDNCIGGVYLTAPIEVGEDIVFVNKREDESGILLQRGDGITMSTRNPGHYERMIITDLVGFSDIERLSSGQESLLRSNGPYFVLDHKLHNRFQKYDAIVSACTQVNGIDLSNRYPCGCGIEICAHGFRCDQSCLNESMVYDEYNGLTWGTGGCCIGPAVSPLPTPAPTVSARGDPHLVNLLGEHFDINHAGEYTLLRIPQLEMQAVEKPAQMELRAMILPEHGRPCTTYITEVELSGAWLGNKVVQVRSYRRSHVTNETDKFLGFRVLRHGAPTEAPWEQLAQRADKDIVLSDGRSNPGFRVTVSRMQWYSNKNAKEGGPNAAGQVEIRVQNARSRSNASATIVLRQDLPRQEHLNLAVRSLSALGRADVGGLLGFDAHPKSLETVTPECQSHREGLDGQRSGPRFTPGWKARWGSIKEQRGKKKAPDGSAQDSEVAASLTSRDTACVCSNESTSASLTEGGNVAQSLLSGGDAEGMQFVHEVGVHEVGVLAVASWD